MRKATPIAVLLLVWAIVIAIVGVGGDFALNDDWAYAWSARHLAQTGEIRILDWAAPSLVSHLAWGALLVKAFGASAVVLRLGTLAWGAGGLIVLYALGRQVGFDERRALVLALAVGLSPWYVNLSFTYMTDVPWLVLMLLAFFCALREQWLAAGILVGAAALSRQFALFMAPAFIWIAWPNRKAALRFALPAAVLYGAFHLWYTRVHGPTIANQQTLARIGEVLHKPWLPPAHALACWHYAGFFAAPFAALAFAWPRRWWLYGFLLCGYGAFAALGTYLDAHPALGPSAGLPPTMPYLGNLAYLVGVGPPTIYDVYTGVAPLPHAARFIGWPLSIVSTLGGIVFAGGISFRSRHARLLLGAALGYLLWLLLTSAQLFDRYVFVLAPIVVILALERVEPRKSLWALIPIALVAIYSVGGTREYLSWNAARGRAVRDLSAAGIADDDVDAGFEINAQRRFQSFVARTHQLLGPGNTWWTTGHERYRIAFWPGACPVRASYPYWTWGATRAVFVLDCARSP